MLKKKEYSWYEYECRRHKGCSAYNDFFDFEGEDVLPLINPVKKLLARLDSLIKID
ncbi:hypothetical protein H6B13_11105 [Bacteroides gallinaceum]|uniref:hypothetical protein n=1 Tax=Bacteroides gallinaceum TaxID=1462571 RepID=UPI0019581D3F|nr:hypothetical protein [Bacteroides gallinaceum]MBM6720171.1 hypothetical protein [Bacteroides gallinaceum]